MFLKNLNEMEKKAFMVLARKVVLTDEQVDIFEQKVMDELSYEMRLPNDLAIALPNWSEAIDVLRKSSNITKRAIIVELLSVCYANAQFTPQEIELIDQVRNAAGIPPEFVEKASSWVQQILKLTLSGHELVRGL